MQEEVGPCSLFWFVEIVRVKLAIHETDHLAVHKTKNTKMDGEVLPAALIVLLVWNFSVRIHRSVVALAGCSH